MLDAISKLLESMPTRKDTLPSSRGVGTLPRNSNAHHVNFVPNCQIEVELSREGMWLLSHYCTPTTTITVREWSIHRLGMLFCVLLPFTSALLPPPSCPLLSLQENQQDWLVHLVALTLHWLQCYYDLLHSATAALEEGVSPGLGGGVDAVDTKLLDQDCKREFAISDNFIYFF